MDLGSDLQSEHLGAVLVDVSGELFPDEIAFNVERYNVKGSEHREDVQKYWSCPYLPLGLDEVQGFTRVFPGLRAGGVIALSEVVERRVLLIVSVSRSVGIVRSRHTTFSMNFASHVVNFLPFLLSSRCCAVSSGSFLYI